MPESNGKGRRKVNAQTWLDVRELAGALSYLRELEVIPERLNMSTALNCIVGFVSYVASVNGVVVESEEMAFHLIEKLGIYVEQKQAGKSRSRQVRPPTDPESFKTILAGAAFIMGAGREVEQRLKQEDQGGSEEERREDYPAFLLDKLNEVPKQLTKEEKEEKLRQEIEKVKGSGIIAKAEEDEEDEETEAKS